MRVRFPLRVHKALWKQGAFLFYISYIALQRVRVRPDSYRGPLRVHKALWKQGAFVVYTFLHLIPTQKRVRVRPDCYRDPLLVQRMFFEISREVTKTPQMHT